MYSPHNTILCYDFIALSHLFYTEAFLETLRRNLSIRTTGTGPLFTNKQWDVFSQDLVKPQTRDIIGLKLFQLLWKSSAPRYRDACQISERYDQYNTKSRGFEISRVLLLPPQGDRELHLVDVGNEEVGSADWDSWVGQPGYTILTGECNDENSHQWPLDQMISITKGQWFRD